MITVPRSAPRLATRAGVVLLCVATWYVTLAPASIGGPLSLVLVRGTSMQPTYSSGDLVIGYRSGGAPQPGQVVVFHGPSEAPVIHRAQAVIGDRLVTRGDNLPVDDPWDTRVTDVIGTARFHLSGVGRLIAELGRPPVLGGLAALLVMLMLAAGTTRSAVPRLTLMVLLVSPAIVIGRAAAMPVAVDQLAALSVPAPYETYMVTPGGGGGGGGRGGGRP